MSINNTGDGIGVLSDSGDVLFTNQAMLKIVEATDTNDLVVKLGKIEVENTKIVEYLREHRQVETGNIDWIYTEDETEGIITTRDITHYNEALINQKLRMEAEADLTKCRLEAEADIRQMNQELRMMQNAHEARAGSEQRNSQFINKVLRFTGHEIKTPINAILASIDIIDE